MAAPAGGTGSALDEEHIVLTAPVTAELVVDVDTAVAPQGPPSPAVRGTPEQPLATVIVPPDVWPGQSFAVQTHLGVVWLAVPPGVGPGSVLIESFKGQWEQSFRAQAAGAAKPGSSEQSRAMLATGYCLTGLGGIVCCIMVVFVVGSWFGSGPFYGCNELSRNSTDVSGADGGEPGVACCPSEEVSQNFGWQTGQECDSNEWCDWSGSGCFDCCSGENTTRKCAVDGLQQHYNFCIRRVLSGYALLQYEACERKLKRSSNGNKLN